MVRSAAATSYVVRQGASVKRAPCRPTAIGGGVAIEGAAEQGDGVGSSSLIKSAIAGDHAVRHDRRRRAENAPTGPIDSACRDSGGPVGEGETNERTLPE